MMQKSDWSERLRAIRFGRSPSPSNYGAKLLIRLVINPTNLQYPQIYPRARANGGWGTLADILDCARQCPLSGVKRTSQFDGVMSATDLKRTNGNGAHKTAMQ